MQALYRRGKLNKSQSQAIAASITRTFSIWQGPPGTGKTNTLVGLMQARPLSPVSILCQIFFRRMPVLFFWPFFSCESSRMWSPHVNRFVCSRISECGICRQAS